MWVGVLLTLSAFGVAVTSALIPPVNLELFLIGLVLKAPQLPWWLLAVVVTVGQIGGKLLYFHLGRGSLRVPAVLRRCAPLRLSALLSRCARRFRESRLVRRWPVGSRREPGTPARWRRWRDRARAHCADSPRRTAAVLLFSAFTSLPPYAWVVVAAGAAKVPTRTFLVTGTLGRLARFSVITAGPALLAGWLF